MPTRIFEGDANQVCLDLGIMDTPQEPEFEDIVQAAAEAGAAPIALVSLLDERRQWFKARLGIDVCETPREQAFCAHAVLSESPLLVADAIADPRFRDNPLVVGPPYIRAYLGAPITIAGGARIGTVCVIDRTPRDWDAGTVRSLQRLARLAGRLIELRARCSFADEQAERLAELRVEDVHFRTIFAAMREGVVLQDSASVILRHNPSAADLLGLSSDQLLGRSSVDPDWDLVDAGGAPLALDQQPSMRCLASGQPVLDQVLGVKTPEGQQRWLNVSSLPVAGVGGPDDLHTVTSFIDITELMAKEAQLREALALAEQASQAKSQFVANVSHEIRTPLNGVVALAGALQQTELSPRQREMVDIVVKSGTALESILNDLLDIAKIEADRMEIEAALFDLPELVEATADLFRIKADDKGVGFRVTVETPWNERYVGDAHRIRQLLWNLTSNAIKFTRDGEVEVKVWVTAREGGPDARTLCIEVRDTGIGIDPVLLPRLFDPFVQADETFTRRFGGTGLGLAICRSIARLLGGDIEARSEPGQGSAFFVRVPLRATDERLRSVDADEAEVREGLRILVVEDNPNNRRVVELLLEPIGADLVMAENGAQAVALIEQGPFDIVLMDMQMPVMDGLTATREIRSRERQRGASPIPIAMMTANAALEHRAAAAEAGANGFITKPVTPAALFGGIQDLMI